MDLSPEATRALELLELRRQQQNDSDVLETLTTALERADQAAGLSDEIAEHVAAARAATEHVQNLEGELSAAATDRAALELQLSETAATVSELRAQVLELERFGADSVKSLRAELLHLTSRVEGLATVERALRDPVQRSIDETLTSLGQLERPAGVAALEGGPAT